MDPSAESSGHEGYSARPGQWAETSETYGLTWPGKRAARRLAQAPTRCRFVSMDGEEIEPVSLRQNLVIEGDSLDALKILKRTHLASFDVVCIDPPYNGGTTADYRDNFHRPQAEEGRAAGLAGGRGGSARAGTSAGRRHSLWLDLMYPRLHLARELLAPTGVIAVSIDDAEAPRLRMLLDEVFGEENHCATIVWEKKYAPANDCRSFSVVHDYVMLYSASPAFRRRLLPRSESANRPYRHDDADGRGPYRASDLSVRTYHPANDYPLVNPLTGTEHRPPAGRCWGHDRASMNRLIEDGRIYWGADGTRSPQLKRYLSDVQDGMVPTTLWTRDVAGHTHAARAELKALFGTTAVFETPKPVQLIRRLLQVSADQDAMVLDFFAGSGTTGHAVMRQNAEDGGHRSCVLVQLGEPIDVRRKPEVAREFGTIAEVTRQRVRRAGEALRAEFPELDEGLTRFTEARIE